MFEPRIAISHLIALRWLILAAAILLLAPSAPAQNPAAQEYEVKAGYLVKFTQYTTWPSNTFKSSNDPVVIGVLGGDLWLQKLEQEARNAISSRPVEVRKITTLDEAARCHLAFLSDLDTQHEAQPRNEAEWVSALKGKPILTVGESDRSIERGAVMRFVIKNKTVRFEANLNAAAENRLELHEKMLAVAAKVYKRPPPK